MLNRDEKSRTIDIVHIPFRVCQRASRAGSERRADERRACCDF